MQGNGDPMSEIVLNHDEWNHSLPKLPKASKIELGPIHGVLPFRGVRNPGSRSSISHRVWFTYRTEANNWQLELGIGESAAEVACGHEVLIDPTSHDVVFQPLTVSFRDEDGRNRNYTHDLMWTNQNGHRRLIFVRNEASLEKPRTWREINAIVAATPHSAADDMIVVNASDYTRQRRENLFRMHQFVFERDEEADEIVLWAARRLKTLWLMRDLFEPTRIAHARVFRSCYRLIARRHMHANLNHVLWENSRVEVAA